MRVVDLLTDASARIGAILDLDKSVARLEARVLAACAWRVAPSWLLAHDTDTIEPAQSENFQALLQRRLGGVPIAYLTGMREFYGREFQVTPDVLIPRPETELLVDLALARIPFDAVIDALDLGTGSGCIGITLALERPQVSVTAVDYSDAALHIAQGNAHKLGARLNFSRSDWFAALSDQKFDLILANPPYIAVADPHLSQGDVRFEPRTALASGSQGLDDCYRIITAAPRHLNPGGTLLLEHGHDQAPHIQNLLRLAGFATLDTWADLAGIDRISVGTLSV